MLRNVLIMASSGLVLFSKDFGQTITQQPRLIGSLLTAIMEFSVVTTGMPVSYIELNNVAVTIVMNDAAKIFCAVFHDKEDGRSFSKLISTEILHAFIDEYQADLVTAGLNLKDFHGFHKKVADVIRSAARPVIAQLQAHKGITKALLVTGDLITYSSADIDQLGVLANLRALINLSADILEHVGSTCQDICLTSSGDSRILVRPLGQSSLIVCMRKSANPHKYRDYINDATLMLEKVSMLASMLQAVSR